MATLNGVFTWLKKLVVRNDLDVTGDATVDGDGVIGGDLDVTGDTTVFGDSTFTGTTTINGTLNAYNGIISTPNDLWRHDIATGGLYLAVTTQTVESMIIALGSNNRHIIVCEVADVGVDFGHTQKIDPTLIMQSSDSSDITQWASFSHNQADAVIEAGKGGLIIPEYTRHIDILPSAATLGPSAPAGTTVDTFRGLGFSVDAEEAFFDVEVPEEWVGNSDMTLAVYWFAESGDAVADTETVKWDINYRSIVPGETSDNGTVETATATHTQSGAGSDKEFYKTEITIDHDSANQPLNIDDTVGFEFSRDVTGDSYSGTAIIVRWELYFTANRPGTH